MADFKMNPFLALGLGMLGANQPSRAPNTFGSVLGRGGMTAMQLLNQQRDYEASQAAAAARQQLAQSRMDLADQRHEETMQFRRDQMSALAEERKLNREDRRTKAKADDEWRKGTLEYRKAVNKATASYRADRLKAATDKQAQGKIAQYKHLLEEGFDKERAALMVWTDRQKMYDHQDRTFEQRQLEHRHKMTEDLHEEVRRAFPQYQRQVGLADTYWKSVKAIGNDVSTDQQLVNAYAAMIMANEGKSYDEDARDSIIASASLPQRIKKAIGTLFEGNVALPADQRFKLETLLDVAIDSLQDRVYRHGNRAAKGFGVDPKDAPGQPTPAREVSMSAEEEAALAPYIKKPDRTRN